MEFPPVTLDSLLGELVELQSDWLDETATQVVAHIASVLPRLRAKPGPLTSQDFVAAFEESPAFLDVCRLFMGVSQETAAHRISAHLSGTSHSWTALRRMARHEPARLADALVQL